MDLRKAFDTVDHDALLRALHDRGVDEGYLARLDLLYRDQVGSVHDSRKFSIEREVNRSLCHEDLSVVTGAQRLFSTRYADDVLI